MSHQIEDHIAAGMDSHLAKPIEFSALFQLLNSTADGLDETSDEEPDMPLAVGASR